MNIYNFTHKPLLKETPPREIYGLGVKYKPHMQLLGWQQGFSRNGEIAGTLGQYIRLEAVRIKIINNEFSLSTFPEMSIRYRAHGQGYGWQGWVQEDQVAGTTGQALRMEAIQIELVNPPPGLHIRYKTYIEQFGWSKWAQDGEMSGTTGEYRGLEAILIELFDDFT